MDSNLHTDEKVLLLRLREGDEVAFGDIMAQYKRPLAKAILRLLKSREDTEEVLQELFLRVWNHRQSIDPDRPIKAYLFRIAENLVYDLLRKAAREKRFISNYLTYITENYPYLDKGDLDADTQVILHQAIDQLPEQRRKVFLLCKMEGKSYEEVSQLLSISIATVNSHITNAHAFLREYFRSNPHLLSILLANMLLLHI